MKKIFISGLLLCLLSIPALSLNPDRMLTQYSQRHWSTKDGLPMNSIEKIAQSADGYIWIGTQEGLVRFDGVHFKVFDRNSTGIIHANWINTLETDKLGCLWIGSWGGGILRYLDGILQPLPSEIKLPSRYVNAILKDRSQTLWVGTENGLVRITNSNQEIFLEEHGLHSNSVLSLAEDSTGAIWIGTLHGLNRLAQRRIEKIHGIPSTEAILTLYSDSDGSMWAGTSSGLILRFQGSEIFRYQPESQRNRIRQIVRDQKGNLWIGSDTGGLKRFRNGVFESLSIENLQGAYEVSGIFEDAEENLWLSTTKGVVQLSDGKIVPYGIPEGLSDDFVWTVLAENGVNKLWVGTFNGGLNLVEGKRVSHFKTPVELTSNAITALHRDHNGDLWIGTQGGGLNQYGSGKFASFTSKDGMAGDWIQSIYEDSHHAIWIGTYGRGLTRLKDKQFTTFQKKNGFPGNSVSSILQDRNGVLWIGGENGLIRLVNETFELLDMSKGLSANDVTCLLEDREGILWIGTSAGLNFLKDGKFVSFVHKDGLYHDHILGILADDFGRLWISSNLGIYSVSRKDLIQYDPKNQKRIECHVYGESDGMRTAECNGGYQPSAWKSSDGKLWFATARGVAMIDPRLIKKNPRQPPVHIQSFVAGSTLFENPSLQKDGMLKIDPGKDKAEIHYTALSYRNPERVRFRYFLEGFDREWVNAGTRRVAYYTNLPPKRYRFRVIAANEDGVWNEAGAALSFELLPFFYQTRWFYALCAVMLVLLLYAAHHYRIRRMQGRLVMILDERYRIARELHDSVAQTMATVVMQLEAAEELFHPAPEKSRSFLSNSLKGARESILHIRKSILDLREEHFTDQDFTLFLKNEILEVSQQSGIQINVRSNGSPIPIPSQAQEQLALITQEAICNAARHAKPQRIDVDLEYSKNHLRLCVKDDGAGFNPYAETAAGHFGLQGMRERAEKLGAKLVIKSQPGEGTEIILEYPVFAA